MTDGLRRTLADSPARENEKRGTEVFSDAPGQGGRGSSAQRLELRLQAVRAVSNASRVDAELQTLLPSSCASSFQASGVTRPNRTRYETGQCLKLNQE